MPNKPAKFGIKFWMAADSTSRYVLSVNPYLGRDEDDGISGTLGEKVVLRQTQQYYQSGCQVVTDNFFTSIELARKLCQKNLTLLGTIRRNKKEIPKELLQTKNRQVNSSVFAFHQEEPCVVVSYLAKKDKNVLLLTSSNFRNTVDNSTEKRKPHIILEYNLLKGGVDTVDQMLSHFSTKMASRRWPLAVFCNMLDIAALNSYTLWKSTKSTANETRFGFIFSLCKSLIREQQEIRAQIVLHPVATVALVAMDVTVPDHNQKRGNCQFCDTKRRNKTTLKCFTCKKWICGKHVSKKICFCSTCS